MATNHPILLSKLVRTMHRGEELRAPYVIYFSAYHPTEKMRDKYDSYIFSSSDRNFPDNSYLSIEIGSKEYKGRVYIVSLGEIFGTVLVPEYKAEKKIKAITELCSWYRLDVVDESEDEVLIAMSFDIDDDLHNDDYFAGRRFEVKKHADQDHGDR